MESSFGEASALRGANGIRLPCPFGISIRIACTLVCVHAVREASVAVGPEHRCLCRLALGLFGSSRVWAFLVQCLCDWRVVSGRFHQFRYPKAVWSGLSAINF